MTLRFPLSLYIHDGIVERNVSRYASELKFKRTAPGGDHSLSVNLDLPRDFFTDLGGGDLVRVDNADGRTIWQGFADNPGRIDGAAGQAFELTALGCAIVANDSRQPFFFIDRQLDGWEQYTGSFSPTSASAGAAGNPTVDNTDGNDGLLCQFNPGQPVGNGQVAQIQYTRFKDAGWEFGAIGLTVVSGKADAGYDTELVFYGGSNGFITLQSALSTSPGSANRYTGDGAGTHPPDGTVVVAVRIARRGAATNVTLNDTWSHFYDLSVVGRRMDRSGTLLTGIAGHVANTHVRADWVVEDLLGRMLLGQVDTAAAVVEVPAVPVEIDQLTFPDGATVKDVLDHLGKHEPGFLWTITADPSGGLPQLAWRQWPLTARYEISTADGFSQPGGDFELCNRLLVKWTDAKGVKRTTTVYAVSAPGVTHPAGASVTPTVFAAGLKSLEDVGRVRDAETIELPEGRGSEANALRIGQTVLAAAADPPKSATATVRRPIVDLLKGGRVMPWEVEPGYLVRVRETGEEIRITEAEPDDDECSVTLTLGNPQKSTEDLVAELPEVRRRVV